MMDTPRLKNEFGSSHTEGGTYSGNRSYSSTETVVRFYRCGRDVMLRTSWITLNPGRRFRGCPSDEVKRDNPWTLESYLRVRDPDETPQCSPTNGRDSPS
ncbi:UNVERIFIED_CONTAM: hypothetical protein Sindi_1684100 [Sesamum indicum]